MIILEERRRVERYLRVSPSLRAKVGELIEDAYEDAVIDAERETGLATATFPPRCEWTEAEILDD